MMGRADRLELRFPRSAGTGGGRLTARPEPDVESPQAVEAAFVFAWEWSIGGKTSTAPELLEDVVYRIRKTVPLNRMQAQAILRQRTAGDEGRAALVLAYEGIGAYREEEDYTFSLADLREMARVRCQASTSFRRAVDLLDALRKVDDGKGFRGTS